MDDLNKIIDTNIKLARFCIYVCVLNLSMLVINFFGISAVRDMLLQIIEKL